MAWCVVKTGAETFDALHAYGLGLVLATASESPVELTDLGLVYRLQIPTGDLPPTSADILDQILTLPTPDDVQAAESDLAHSPVSVANLDGLLAALFTTPGLRAAGVVDLVNRQQLNPATVSNGLVKVNTALTKWKRYAERKARRAPDWLVDVLQDYDAASPKLPMPANATKASLNVLMPLDPALSYSTRRPRSDGLITDKTNIALPGTRYAVLLALVGAARFLRAQRVAGKLVNFYVPLPISVTLQPDTALPLLYPTPHPAYQAIALRWLVNRHVRALPEPHWSGLAYQIMQTQGAQQSISRDRGCLDWAWLDAVERRVGRAVIRHWKRLLASRREFVPFEIDDLVDCLLSHRAADWQAHLRQVALYWHSHPEADVRLYSLQEVKEITAAMNQTAPPDSPLSAVLQRPQGTLHFGHALRLLGQHNPAPLRDLVAALDTVQTRDQLLRILAQAAQECAVAGAKTEFILVPSDEDLAYLLDDTDRYGAPTIARLLVLLSALRYPRISEPQPVVRQRPRPGGFRTARTAAHRRQKGKRHDR
ncbi:MAG: hypothetical protein KKA73_22325 [Chloroflexi bacterium]|nr:hypothetical protein [Chloroflexota bacterium]MBU1750430.1 hypothetical protein [Chloroflexota bacterium]